MIRIPLITFTNSLRNLHISVVNANIGKSMRKVLGNSTKKKHGYWENSILPKPDTFSKGSNEGRYSGSARRVIVLNKMFMKYITDLFATGEYAALFSSHGIEINRVTVSPDFKGLNVFWTSNSTDQGEEVEVLLNKSAGYFRHELSTLRVMGNVPKIYFVKDKHFFNIREVDLRLERADFGEDYKPVEHVKKLKSQLELIIELSPDIKKKINELDIDMCDEHKYDNSYPAMPQDVLGLNHSDILNRIKRRMKKAALPRRCSENSSDFSMPLNENPVEYATSKERKEAFENFIHQRELIRSKARKLNKNYLVDKEYITKEIEERHAEFLKNLDTWYPDEDDTNDIDSDEENQ